MSITPPAPVPSPLRSYRGRTWAAGIFIGLGLVCLGISALIVALAIADPTIEHPLLFVILFGPVLFPVAGLALAAGFAEAVSAVELAPDRISVRLPSMRGVVALLPVRRLSATWPDIRAIGQRVVRLRFFGIPIDYAAFRIATARGDIELQQPLPSPYFLATQNRRQSIPAAAIVDEVSRRSGIAVRRHGEVRSGGLVRTLIFGAPPWSGGDGPPPAPVPAPSGTSAPAARAPARPRPAWRRRLYKVVSSALGLLGILFAIDGVLPGHLSIFDIIFDPPQALVEQGLNAFDRKDPAAAAELYRQAAERGNARGQALYAEALWKGQGVARNDAVAAAWFRRSAELGFAPAETSLGYFLAHGIGLLRDDGEAVRWYQKAAAKGDARAKNNLGVMLDDGRGIERDKAEAVRWYRASAEQGDVLGQYNFGRSLEDGGAIPADQAEAVRWLSRAANQGDADAQLRVGRHYAAGTGVAPDLVEAHLWLALAAKGLPEGGLRAKAIAELAAVDRRLGADQLAAADRRVAGWKPKKTR